MKILSILLLAVGTSAQFNYDERKVPSYRLIDPLHSLDDRQITAQDDWPARRAEILALFQRHVYGHTPTTSPVRFEVFESNGNALGGLAIRRQIRAHFTAKPDGLGMDILILLPTRATRPVPLFLTLNFFGNHSIIADPGIRLPQSWVKNNKSLHIKNNRATDASRGVRSYRWDVKAIINAGFGLATVYYGDIEPDHPNGFKHGIRSIHPSASPAAWGAIGAWAWGLSRALDYLETDAQVDATRVAVMGHSRLGKTALWAGATDTRFAITISNDSGCGGAALSKRRFGETIARINKAFPHWFCENFNAFNDNEFNLPFDQHMLLALVAPRALYIASAHDDRWADPRGEFLAARAASPVYQLLQTEGLPAVSMPTLNHPSMGQIGYHIRRGKHDVTDYDWAQYIRFATKHLVR